MGLGCTVRGDVVEKASKEEAHPDNPSAAQGSNSGSVARGGLSAPRSGSYLYQEGSLSSQL